jgi:hypothetical protein
MHLSSIPLVFSFIDFVLGMPDCDPALKVYGIPNQKMRFSLVFFRFSFLSTCQRTLNRIANVPNLISIAVQVVVGLRYVEISFPYS